MARYYFYCTGGSTYTGNNTRFNPSWWSGNYASGHLDNYREYHGEDHTLGAKSLVLFNSSSIRSTLAGTRITGCYIDLYVRYSYASTFTLWLGTHNYTSLPDVWSNSRVNVRRVSRSVSDSQIWGWNIGTTIGSELRDGVATGITLGPAPDERDIHYNEIAPNGHSREPVLIIDAEASNVAPTAPTLLSPAPDTVMDIYNSGASFQWRHNDPNGDSQAAWRFRRKLPNGTYDWWNGTSFVTSETNMTTSVPASGLAIPAGLWASDQRIEWSVATRDPAGLWGPYSGARVLYSSIRPSTTVTAPPDSPDTPRPTIRWTYSDPDGDPQYGWAVQIVEPSVYTDPTWNPDQYLRQVWSNSGSGTSLATPVGVDLRNHRTYRAYVKVASSPNPSGGLQWSGWGFKEFQVVVPPSASSITFPLNGSVADLGAGFTMTWSNSFYQGVGSQTAFSIRRLVSGSSTYEYWNGAAWVTVASGGTIPYLAGGASAYSFRPGDVLNGFTYTYYVSIRDDYNAVSPWSSGVTVEASTAAQVTVLSPPSVSVVSNPTVTWTMFDIENDPQQTYQVRIIHQNVFGTGVNIDPGTATAVWDSTEVIDNTGTVRNVEVPVDLENANVYRAYVRVRTNGVYSGWSYSEFRVSLVPPASPTAEVTIGEDFAEITVQGRDNMLNDDTSRNFSDWDAATNCTIQNAVLFGSSQSGYASSITATAAGSMTVVTHEAYPCAPGHIYTGAVSAIAPVNVTPVTAYASLEFFDISGTEIRVVSATPISDESAVRLSVTAEAPVDASYVRIRVTFQAVPNAGDTHQIFDPVLRPSTGSEWSPGGSLGNTFITVIETTEDRAVRYARNIPVPTDTQVVVVRDYEVRMGAEQIYAVRTRAVYPNAALVTLPVYLEPVRWVSGWVWLSDPLRPGSGRSFQPQSFDAVTRPVRQGKFRPIGRPDAVITTGVRGLREGGYTIVTHDRGTRRDYEDLSDLSEVLLLRIPPDTADPTIADPLGETLYVRLEGDAPEERPLSSRTPHRVIKQSWTEQRAPETGFEYSELD